MPEQSMRTIGGIEIDSRVEVSKGHPVERDMYGGAVRLAVCWEGGMAALELDPDGVACLREHLVGVLAESRADYAVSRSEAV